MPMNTLSPNRFVFVGNNQQIQLHQQGGQTTQLTYDLLPSGQPAGCVWPVWSPNNRWIAYFQLGDETVPPNICITEVDGMEQRILTQDQEGLPIYASWSPDSTRLAVLYQLDELFLIVYNIDQLGEGRLVAEGAPLFFRWLEDSSGILIHSIRRREKNSNLINKSLMPYGEDHALSQRPGAFTVPVLFNGTTIFAEKSKDEAYIYQSGLNGDDRRLLLRLDGIVSMQAHPSKPFLAISRSPDGEGTPAEELLLLNLENNEQTKIMDSQIHSFTWDPLGIRLILTRVDTNKRCMHLETWSEEVGHQYLHPFWPTREQIFHIHFFEQFLLSHSQISPCGNHFVYSGYRKKDFSNKMSLDAYIFTTDLNTFKTQTVCKGQFATYSSGSN